MAQESETRQRVTIMDVARHAGVSRAAVSKVLRNAYGVSPAMQEKVRAAMTELEYRPRAAARGMRGRTWTIGVLLDSIRNPFFADILDGVRDALLDSEYTVLIGAAGFGAAAQNRTLSALVDRQMDGLILIAPGVTRAETLAVARATPTVVIGHHDASDLHDSIVDADADGAALLVDHLVTLGHRDIALVSAPGTKASRWQRTPEIVLSEGYLAAMQRHGLGAHCRVHRADYSDDGGYRSGLDLFADQHRPSAVICGADVAALGLWRAAIEMGLRVPQDVSIAGYNNTAVADLAMVQLTSVDQAGHEMGASAARLLIDRVEGRRDRAVHASMTPRLMARASTARPPD